MIKILHLMPTSGPGGAEKLLLEIISSLDRAKYHSIVGVLSTGWLTGKIADAGIDFRVIRSRRAFDYILLKDLVHIIRTEGIDIIHSHLLDMNLYAAVASKITKIPVICTEHGDIHHTSQRSWKKAFKAKIISRLTDRIVFVSQYTKEYFQKHARLSPTKTAVIYNGINESIYERVDDEQKRALRQKLSLDKDVKIIGNVGNLYPVKGQMNLIHAFHIVKKQLPDIELLIVGRGELEAELKMEVEKLGLKGSVRFLGFREDVNDILKSMDVFVLSSLSEGLPLALIEAMSCGLAVVTTDVGGAREVIQDGVDGFIVPTQDPISLADRIRQVLEDGSTVNRLRENAYKKIREVFSKRSMLRKYEELYSELTDQGF